VLATYIPFVVYLTFSVCKYIALNGRMIMNDELEINGLGLIEVES
jgi:hypothetical protein